MEVVVKITPLTNTPLSYEVRFFKVGQDIQLYERCTYIWKFLQYTIKNLKGEGTKLISTFPF